ncbi:MAG: hypothetical protein J5598_04235, partial [Clostridia bacterium]|nr:hypothetical protein [Clostridia bacterium]
DECGEKGFVLLEINDHTVKSQFVPFAQRQLIELTFDVTLYRDWFALEDQVLATVQNYSQANLLKITLVGKYPLAWEKHVGMLEQKLGQFYFAKVKDETVLQVQVADVANDISLRGEFIRQVLASNLTDAEKEQTILVGLKALAGEDL